jgi:hypothetical protein
MAPRNIIWSSASRTRIVMVSPLGPRREAGSLPRQGVRR